ncbi:MAG TPA: helix-turn-helix domain-containing protein [Solirubrobacterales bacterium]|nr:helix-turn-helix domain-containing protein [Solirubrobacterales bacterium]
MRRGDGRPVHVIPDGSTDIVWRQGGGPPWPAPAAQRLRDPGRRVDEIATALGFSERQLRRRFLATVGYGPKTLQRILRMRRFLKLASVDGLAGGAAAAGYADQAHLSREVRALTGLTPSEILTPQRAIRKTAKATARTPPATSQARA